MKTQMINGISEVHPEELKPALDQARLIDVRQPDEFTGELGHIPGAELVTLGPDLGQFLQTAPKDQEIVFICRSGARSGHATMTAQDLGFQKAHNMTGGMILWNQLGYEVER